MPSELYNWDRRKHEGAARWRERSFHHHHYLNDTRRHTSGHGKQGSRNPYVDEFGHELMPSRPTEKMSGDDSYRPSGSGRYGRYSREYRGSFVQKDWKAHPSEIALQPNGSGKLKSTTDQRPVDVMPSHVSSTPSSDSIDSREQSFSKYQHENNDVGSMGSTGQKLERENSLTSINWKPLKWTRSESLSLRNSGFSHSSSSKSLEPVSSDMKTESMQENVTSVLSPAGAATACFAAEAPNAAAEVMNSRKKPRLGWGEGLAKYEKKKVESSDESEKNGAITYGSNVERSRSYASNCSDKSPKLMMVPQCASPATPSSVACSSSHGMEEKQIMKTASTDHDSAYICNSPSVTQNNADRSFDLGELDLTTNFNLKSSIEELLKSDDPTVDSSFVRSTAMNKLLLLKNHISKEVETTETEIDLLENELKTMISGSVPVARLSKPYDHSAAPNVAPRLAGLHVVVDSNVASKDDNLVLKDVDVDSPGSATSKFVDVSLRKDSFPLIMSSEVEAIGDSGLSMSNREMEPEINCLIEEKPITDGIGSRFVGRSSVSSDDDSLNIYNEDFPRELILASKRDCEQIASEMISKLLPSSGYHYDFSSVVKASCVQNDLVKKRFLRKTYYYKLKEKILTLKFKILWHLWKGDTHIRYLKKLRGRTQKKFELSSRKSHRSYQKYRPSVRSGYFSTAGASLLASTEQLSYASRLLAEPQIKPLRSVLKMPSMIIDRRERMATRFISYNGLMEDPLAAEKERPIIKSWSEEDEELFIDKLTEFGKDFKKIAISLGRKTTDCVEFYYKNHKSDAFKRAKKKPEFAEHLTMPYLLTSEQRLNLEADAASQKIYGGASLVGSMIDDFVEIQEKHTSRSFLASGSYKMESGGDDLVDRSSSQSFYDNERETVAADVLAGICCSLSSEAMNSCITSSLDPGGGYQDHKYQIIGPSTRRPLTPEVIQNVVETCTDESCGDMDPTDWTDEEKTLLIQAVATYGKDFTMISRCVRTKTRDQCKVFFSKARKCLGLDKTCSGSENMITDDVNGGRRDACFLESGSVICNGKSTRIDEDVASVNLKLGHSPMKPDLRSAQGIVVGEMDCTHSLASKNLLPVDQRMEKNFELALEGNDESRNSAVLASNLDVSHGTEQGMMEVETVQCSCKPLIPEASNVSQHLGRDFCLHSCHSRKYASSDAELASAHHEGDPSAPPSGSQPCIEKLSTNGDVKLFGQILGKTSQHKAYSSAPVGEVCSSQHHSLGSESSSVKCSGSQQAGDGISSHMNNRISNGASTLPHSTILLARYPTAFGNYVPPSSKIELQSSNGVVKSGECSLNGVPTLSNKDLVSNGSADLHMCRNQELQSLSILAQMERNGFDVSPGLQQQSGDMVAINVVGRKTVLGGQFVGVSDPVAAIKMHYAKSEQQQYSGGRLTSNIIREDDPWRGKGNVGR